MAARTVHDVLLGEATRGTRSQRLRDMIGIASVVANRARQLGVDVQSVISAPGEFDAYGKPLPAGADEYRDLAREAWDYVQKVGPINNATFYATPAAAKNLPTGLAKVSSTTGHQFYADPKNRAIKTAAGYITPAGLPASAPTPAARPANINRTGPVPGFAARRTSAPAKGLGMMALAPSMVQGQLVTSGVNYTHPERGHWTKNVTPAAVAAGSIMATNTPGGVKVTSAYRSPAVNASVGGARNSQHVRGNAIDIDLAGMTDVQKAKAVELARATGATRIGAYSLPNESIHLDFASGYPPNSRYAADVHPMFNESVNKMAAAPGWFTQGLRQTAFPTPTPKPSPVRPDNFAAIGPSGLVAVPDRSFAAPFGKVERGRLKSAAKPTAADLLGLTRNSVNRPPTSIGTPGPAPMQADAARSFPARPEPSRSVVPARPGQLGGLTYQGPKTGRTGIDPDRLARTVAPAPIGRDRFGPALKAATAGRMFSPASVAGASSFAPRSGKDAATLTRDAQMFSLRPETTPTTGRTSLDPDRLTRAAAPAPYGGPASRPMPMGSLLPDRAPVPAARPSAPQPVSSQALSKAIGTPSPARPDNLNYAGPKVGPGGKVVSVPDVPVNPNVSLGAVVSRALAAPAPPPAQILAPALAPPVSIPDMPIAAIAPPAPAAQAQSAFPAAPRPAPSFTPSDIYGGQIGQARSTSGNLISRDAFGNTAVTNAWGKTTNTNSKGYQSPIAGPLGGAGIPSTPSGGLLGKTGSQWGQAGKTGLGLVGGSVLGGLVAGPIGGLLGAALGKEMSKPGGGLLGGMLGGLGGRSGQFPDRPSPVSDATARASAARAQAHFGGSRGGDYRPGDSPRADAAVRGGGGGLY